jgi:glycosyltransferase involved in cell wall biosynthesis
VHVLYVIDSLVPGGAERSLATLAPHLVARGVALEVAVLHDRPGLQPQLEDAGAPVVSLGGGGGRVQWFRRCSRLVRETRPDLVHTTLFEADVVGRLAAAGARVPVVSSIVNETYGAAHLADPQLVRWKVRGAQFVDAATARLARRFHAVSEHVADTMAHRLRLPRARFDVIPRTRDSAYLGVRSSERRAAARAALGIGDGTRLVVAAARLDYAKGLDVLVEAFPQILVHVPDARLLLVGRAAADAERVAGLVGAHGLQERVSLLGERDDVAELLCAADALVLPSRREGFPGVLLEAMVLRAPIVATDIAQNREVVGDDCALLVPVEDPGALADGVVQTLHDPAASEARAARAFDRFHERFSVDRIADATIEFYERALRQGSH